MITKIFTFIIVSLSSFSLYSQVQEEALNVHKEDDILQTFFFVDYSLMKMRVRHEEESGDSGFTNLDDHNDIGIHHLSFKYLIDLVPTSSFSIFVAPFVGYMHGENNNRNSGPADNIDYWDSVSGLSYGGQAGISYRFVSHGLIMAPYISAGSITADLKNFLRFEQSESSSSSNEFEHELKANITETALGIRFTSLTSGYSSHLSIINYSMTTSSIDGDASSDGNNYTLSKLAEFEMDHLTFQVGFGARF